MRTLRYLLVGLIALELVALVSTRMPRLAADIGDEIRIDEWGLYVIEWSSTGSDCSDLVLVGSDRNVWDRATTMVDVAVDGDRESASAALYLWPDTYRFTTAEGGCDWSATIRRAEM